MNIYLIADKKRTDKVIDKLSKEGKVTVVQQLEDIVSFNDPDEKVIGVAPGLVDWKLPREELEKIKNIKGICTLSAWAQWIDLEYCKQNNILVANTPGANSQSVAEYAIWMMFSLARKLSLQIAENFETHDDEIHYQSEILGKTMGIVGLGNIGGRIAKMGKGLGMNVIYWSPKSRNDDYRYTELTDLLKESDYVFNCVETYQKTKNLFDRDKLFLMKKTACFISVLGGMGYGQEDDNYIIEAVNKGNLGGFAVEGEHEKSFVMTDIKSGSNIFVSGNYAYYTLEAETRSLEKWVKAIAGVITQNYKYLVH
ncbi:MAG: hypothetical protein HYV90_03890 [Candidatus Woesebacteria bacterium]|nr:MAG: hypothetical protein HYV90_03890 [Candidatus Woesebacteria bacterium]